MMLKVFLLVGGVLLAATPVSLLAQVGGCSACETAIRDKLTELDDRTSKTNLLVKTIDRKFDPLAAKVDTLDNKLTVLEEKIDAVGVQILQLSTGGSIRSAVVIELANTASDLPVSSASTAGQLKASDALAGDYCQRIGYTKGKALQVNDVPPQPNTPFATWRRELPRIICFMI